MADITFSAASTAGLNNPGTEIITLVKDAGGNFVNPPSYDKIRAYLRSGEVPCLFVTDEGGATGSLYQLVDYSETENKIRFSNSANAIEFCAGCVAPVVSDVVPKPLTYDYMPEGYPSKSVQTTTLMEEQELAFASMIDEGQYMAQLTNAFNIVVGQTYTVNWDGTDYECVGYDITETVSYIGNTFIEGTGDDTGEPFIYTYNKTASSGLFITLDTSASHTISVKRTEETVTPIAEEFLPNIPADKLPAGGVTTLHINVTAVNTETMEATFTADRTPSDMQQATANGPVWCVVSFAAGVMTEEAFSIGLPPAWIGGEMAFGLVIARVHEDGGNNDMRAAVVQGLDDTWSVDLAAFGS